MHKLARACAIGSLLALSLPSTAHADVGIGVFLGQPSGLDIKVGLGRRSGLDILVGVTTYEDNRTNYVHVTYLLTPFVARGRSVLVPFRLGIGGALLGIDENVHGAVRVPLQIGFRFRRTPIEIYGEIALKGTFYEDPVIDFDLDGGIGIRFYF